MVASIDNLENAAVQKNNTVEKLVITKENLTDSIAILQAHNLKIIKLVKKLTAGTISVSNPSKDAKPPWDLTIYCWSHGYKIHT